MPVLQFILVLTMAAAVAGYGGTTRADNPAPQPSLPPIELAAEAFADACVAALPDLNGVKFRQFQVSQRDFGVTPDQAARDYFLTDQPRGGIFMNLSLGAGRENTYQCAMAVRRQDPATVAQTLVGTLTTSGFAMTPTRGSNAQQAWTIDGARPGMVLKTSSRRNALGQDVTGVWMTWR